MEDRIEDHWKVAVDLCKDLRKDFNMLRETFNLFMAKIDILLNESAAREKAQIENNIIETDATLKVSTLKTDSDGSNYICIDNVVCEIEVNELETMAKDGLSSNIEKIIIDDDIEWDEEISFDHSNCKPLECDDNQYSNLGFGRRPATNVVEVKLDVYIQKIAHKLVCDGAVRDVMGKAPSRGIGLIKGVSEGSFMILGTAKRTLWDPGIYNDFHVSGVRY
jgi:hypothetical protein